MFLLRCCCIDRQIVVGTNSSLWAKKHCTQICVNTCWSLPQKRRKKKDIAAICILNSEDVYTCLCFLFIFEINEIHVCVFSSWLLMVQLHHHTSSFFVPSILQLEIFSWEKQKNVKGQEINKEKTNVHTMQHKHMFSRNQHVSSSTTVEI